MANIFMRFPEGKAKALTLSYDDGVQQDIRLMNILDKHGIKCTFNINTGLFAKEGTVYPEGQVHRRMTEKECINLYKDSEHEVAVHALTHPWLEKMPESAVVNEVLQDRLNIERIFGTLTRGMAYPYGTYSDTVVECLKKCGIVYSRTVECTKDFTIPTDWLRLKATCHHNDPELDKITDRFINNQPDNDPWLFYLWGHSYEFERDNNWEVMESFSEKIGYKEEVWYAVNIDVYDYHKAYLSLDFSPDYSMVHNPSALKVWFIKDGVLNSVNPGETIRI